LEVGAVSAWKDLERRVCRALGAERAGPRGKHGSDDDGSAPFSVEVKRTARMPAQKAIAQARRQGKQDGRPWLLVMAGHNDSRPIAVLDFWVLAELAQKAGLIQVLKVEGATITVTTRDPDE
jgi:hypothetical protein